MSRPAHPGTLLASELMERHGVTQYRLAVDTGVPPRRINEIVHGQRGITADTALRLGRYFGNEPEYWMGLQAVWELDQARRKLGSRLESEVKVLDPAVPHPGRGRPRRPFPEDAEKKPSERVHRDRYDHLFVD